MRHIDACNGHDLILDAARHASSHATTNVVSVSVVLVSSYFHQSVIIMLFFLSFPHQDDLIRGVGAPRIL